MHSCVVRKWDVHPATFAKEWRQFSDKHFNIQILATTTQPLLRHVSQKYYFDNNVLKEKPMVFLSQKQHFSKAHTAWRNRLPSASGQGSRMLRLCQVTHNTVVAIKLICVKAVPQNPRWNQEPAKQTECKPLGNSHPEVLPDEVAVEASSASWSIAVLDQQVRNPDREKVMTNSSFLHAKSKQNELSY